MKDKDQEDVKCYDENGNEIDCNDMPPGGGGGLPEAV